jgi:hypothetical protein
MIVLRWSVIKDSTSKEKTKKKKALHQAGKGKNQGWPIPLKVKIQSATCLGLDFLSCGWMCVPAYLCFTFL